MIRLHRNRWLIGAGMAIALSGTGGVYLQAKHALDQADPAHARRAGRPIPVRTAQVTRSEVDQVVGGTAVTEPSLSAVIQIGTDDTFSSAELVVKAVHMHEGDFVRKGQVLLELDESFFAQVLKRQELALAAAEASLKRTKAELALNVKAREMELQSAVDQLKFRIDDLKVRKTSWESYIKLRGDKVISSLEFDDPNSIYLLALFQQQEAVRALDKTKDTHVVAVLKDAETEATVVQQLEVARVGLEAARRDLARCTIRSPIDGWVDLMKLVPGSVVTTNTPLTQVLGLEPLHVRMDFPQDRIDDVAVGQRAEVVLDNLPKETFQGTVIRISPNVSTDLRVMPVVIRLDDSGRRLRAGISGFVRIRVSKPATVVPATALIEEGPRSLVFRVEQGRARMREVRIGHTIENGLVEVRGGLAAGDEVVIYNNFYKNADKLTRNNGLLLDNDAVDTDWRRWARHE
jgi:RND family efflux transporter MFP subunit